MSAANMFLDKKNQKTHIVAKALLGPNLTLVVELEVESHQVEHVPEGGGAGSLTEHLQIFLYATVTTASQEVSQSKIIIKS